MTPAQPNSTLPDAFLEARPNSPQLPITNYQLPIPHQSLNQLAAEALQISRTSPRQGWQLMVDVEAAIQFQKDDFLAAKAAWYHGRLANEYGRPILAHAALDRAEQLFTNFNEPGWKAAVLWQRHALPWASANLALAIQALETAAGILENSPAPRSAFVPHCRLTLAYAKLLKGSFNGLPELLQQCLDYFTETNDLLYQARTHFVHSGYLRRTAPYEQAKAASLRGLEQAQAANAAADIARFHLQIGFNHWLGDGNFEAAAESFKTAADEFQALDMPGWLAQCQDGLAQVYIMTGRLAEATALIENALTIFRDEVVIG